MDEIFGPENFVALITVEKTSAQTSDMLSSSTDYAVFYSKDANVAKFRQPLEEKQPTDSMMSEYASYQDERGSRYSLPRAISPSEWLEYNEKYRLFSKDNTTSNRPPGSFPVVFRGRSYVPGSGYWKTGELGFQRLIKADRVETRGSALRYVRFFKDYPVMPINNIWRDVKFSSRREDKTYVVQSSTLLVERCILMTTDPGDLVLDPTCGSGTTAYVAEQWGRRWITIDTSRVALALARARVMGARYPWYVLADTREGQLKEAEVTRSVPRDTPTFGRIRQGFVYKRVPHITLKSIANNAEIDTIWEKWQRPLDALRQVLNDHLQTSWEEWEVPRTLTEAQASVRATSALVKLADVVNPEGRFAHEVWKTAADIHAYWWELRIERQKEIDASIAAKADTEFLYDKPYEDPSRVRVAGPFTVESLSPHRVAAVDMDDSLFDQLEAAEGRYKPAGESQAGAKTESADFVAMVLDNLRRSGVQQRDKDDRLAFDSLKGWPGRFICAEGRVRQASEADVEGDMPPARRAAILVGPEYGTVARPDLTAAAREAAEAGFDLLIAAAFNFDAHASEFERMGALTVLKARINPDLHMPDLANTGAGNLFTVFGEPDIVVHDEGDGQVSIEVAGIDMYKGGAIESSSADDIAAWFVDTDYDYESFFVRQAYFPGQTSDPYKALKVTLRTDIDEEAWASLKRTRSRPFQRPASGRVAVKVINHLGDEVMKVVGV